jgi:DNA (cytosine-5)-methyltransferase 1
MATEAERIEQEKPMPIEGAGVPKNHFTVLSLFSGGMGLDIGLEQTGQFHHLACVEKIPAFCETIRRNRDAGRLGNRNLTVYEKDIAELPPAQIMRDLRLAPGELDLLVGGPPCQTFSTTGKRATVQDPRGTLLWQFLHFVEELQPKFFVMENVRGLMSAALRHRPIKNRPDKGGPPLEADEEPGSVIQRFLLDLRFSYRIDCFEVNAVNYGAPQLRERALFIGNRFNRLVEFPAPTHGERREQERTLFDMGDGAGDLKPFRTLREALEGLVETKPAIMDFSPRKKRYLAMIPEGSNWRSLPPEIAKESMGKAYVAKGGRSGWWRRLTFDLPCPTIVTMPNHAGTALCHPTETRALTLRECARVQEFPDDWEFRGTTQQQYTQVGNAVPVRLGKICGELVAQELADLYQSALNKAEGGYPAYRIVYVKSHIRTRQWFKGGKTFVWQEGEENGQAKYRPSKTERKVKLPPKE